MNIDKLQSAAKIIATAWSQTDAFVTPNFRVRILIGFITQLLLYSAHRRLLHQNTVFYIADISCVVHCLFKPNSKHVGCLRPACRTRTCRRQTLAQFTCKHYKNFVDFHKIVLVQLILLLMWAPQHYNTAFKSLLSIIASSKYILNS